MSIMHSIDVENKKWKKYLIVLGALTILSSFLAILKILQYSMEVTTLEFFQRQIRMIFKVYIWGLFSWSIFYLVEKYEIKRNTWYKILSVHLSLSLIYSAIHTYLYFAIIYILHISGLGIDNIDFERLMILSYRFNFVIYWGLFGASLAVKYYREYKSREIRAAALALRAANLETQLTNAKLDLLKSQLQPHFLFNTLHNINGLLYVDKDAASSMISNLSDLLRMTLDRASDDEISLKEEIEVIEKYITIQKSRFDDSLLVKINISTETYNMMVPNMILQPIVENAFVHGVESNSKGEIEINSTVLDGKLILEIHDNGKDPIKITDSNLGVGLSNTISRLKQLYDNEHEIDFSVSHLGGTLVKIAIPQISLK